jgi:hypothetical protein
MNEPDDSLDETTFLEGWNDLTKDLLRLPLNHIRRGC